MRILICDDDNMITGQLTKYINEFFKRCDAKCPEIACFCDGESLLADSGEKDILFLDVEMPGMNGIYVGTELKHANPNIIIFIVTSYMEYLDEAMRFHVFRYLSKPLEKQRLFRNLKDAINLYHTSAVKVPIETKQGVHTISASDIILIETTERKTIVHTVSGDYESIYGINYWLQKLPYACFFYPHRSFLINFEHVASFDHSLIYLADYQFEAYLTKRKYKEFRENYLLYLESKR